MSSSRVPHILQRQSYGVGIGLHRRHGLGMTVGEAEDTLTGVDGRNGAVSLVLVDEHARYVERRVGGQVTVGKFARAGVVPPVDAREHVALAELVVARE